MAALQKQPIDISFSQGLDTKTDPKRVQIGKFLALNNSVFDKAGSLVKRNGYKNLTKLPNTDQTTLVTYKGNLLATGSNLYAYSSDTDKWLDRGVVQPVDLATQALVRTSKSQSQVDAAVASTGLCCLVYKEGTTFYYQVSDSETTQQIVNQTALPTGVSNVRVALFDRFFMITFIAPVGPTFHLQYIAVPISNPLNPTIATDIATSLISTNAGYDVLVANNKMYASYATAANSVETVYVTPQLIVSSPEIIAGYTATAIALAFDTSVTEIIVAFYDSVTQDGYIRSYTSILADALPVTPIIVNENVARLTSVSQNGLTTVMYEINNTYSFTPNTPTNYIKKVTVTSGGSVSAASVVLRSVGLASKAFINADNLEIYVLATYQGTNEPTYFLINSDGDIFMRLAGANGTGYLASQVLPLVSLLDTMHYIPYTLKTFLAAVNKETNLPTGTPVNGIYTQAGVNLAKFEINTSGQYSSEIAETLHLTGGMLWQYDGVKPVENGFHLYPEDNTVTTSTTGGLIAANTYYYVFTYEWTDNQGNLHRSAPSVPVKIVTTGSTSSNTLNVPTLRVTYKTDPNPVRIVGYRWSVAQQQYYQFTSITAPVINDTSIDSVTITDTLADSAILGNVLLYTTGGVLENISAPASIATALFKNRLWLIDAENRNQLRYSKPIFQNTPVEMTDLQTVYVAPTSGAQGSTGDCTALTAMDDKLIIFKENAIYYMTGQGPDATGANNDFQDPIFITAAVGTINPNSIVVMPTGVMFQSNKGIWLLRRDLATIYIGAPVEKYNNYICYSARTIPGTNQVRFVMSDNVTLMYDFYYEQWGTFNNIKAISSTLFEDADTYLNDLGYVYQETPNMYLDGSTPVLMSFTTSWVSLAGVQGYERFYFMYLLGTYYTPFKLDMQIAYDYNPSAKQNVIVTPDNYNPAWGGLPNWGSGEYWGGPGNNFEARVFPATQKCETFQITMNEVFDPLLGTTPGQGLTLTGLNIIVGMKRGYRTQKASQSFG